MVGGWVEFHPLNDKLGAKWWSANMADGRGGTIRCLTGQGTELALVLSDFEDI